VKRYWVSSNKMTFEVVVDDREIVVDVAPIARKFVGQPFSNLRRWMAKQGGLEVIKQGS
jgi:hypothetical protein